MHNDKLSRFGTIVRDNPEKVFAITGVSLAGCLVFLYYLKKSQRLAGFSNLKRVVSVYGGIDDSYCIDY